MVMSPIAVAVMVLFGGENLDGWITHAGKWMVQDGVMICQSAPASIRSTWEADDFVLSFEYRRADKGLNRVAIHSRMTTGGPLLLLTPRGALWPQTPPLDVTPAGEDDWIRVKIKVADQRMKVRSRWDGGETAQELQLPAGERGFLRFETQQPGLEVRQVTVYEPGFVRVCDDESLEGWEPVRPKTSGTPGWTVSNGVLRCGGSQSSWLRSLRTYDNLILRLEYQLPPRGNSGIYLRAPMEGRVSRIGLEVQLLDDVPFRGLIKPAQHCGSVYDGIAPEIRVPAPARQWNAIEVLLDGDRIRTTLNGIQLYDARLDDATKDTNYDVRPLATRRTVGFVGLQDHAHAVMFRNIRIRRLP